MSLHEPTRGGNRGGAGNFKWSDVVQDKHRDHYVRSSRCFLRTQLLTHAWWSIGHNFVFDGAQAPVGRWQKNKDITWYNKDQKDLDDDDAKREEMRTVKEAEADAMSLALGFAPNYRPAGLLAGESSRSVETPEERAQRKSAKEARRQERASKRADKELRRRQRSRSPNRRHRSHSLDSHHRDYDNDKWRREDAKVRQHRDRSPPMPSRHEQLDSPQTLRTGDYRSRR